MGNETQDDCPAVSFHLLGEANYDDVVRLQDRIGEQLAKETPIALEPRRRIVVLFCEHSPLITVGRRGSWRQLAASNQGIGSESVAVKWVARSGGCIMHGPGQLAAYVLASLESLAWSVTEFRSRIHQGCSAFLAERGLMIRHADPASGIWGRVGGVLAYGWGRRDSITHHGFYLNVHPITTCGRPVDFVPPDEKPSGCSSRMSSLLVEQRQPVRMTDVRAGLLPALASALDCERYHVFTGHPLFSRATPHVPRPSHPC